MEHTNFTCYVCGKRFELTPRWECWDETWRKPLCSELCVRQRAKDLEPEPRERVRIIKGGREK